jgi:glycosyltransferase involved in cell wall biosynthesis
LQGLDARGARVLQSYCAPFTPKLSIVIPTFNTAQWVNDAIRSALMQTEEEIEVVVVDDGSSDSSLAQVLAFQDPRLTILTQPNSGLSAARNSGILVAKAELIGFLDSDDVWFPDKAKRHLHAHKMFPNAGLSFSWSAYMDEAGHFTGQYLMSPLSHPDAMQLTRRNHVGNGSTPVVRRRCFETAGLFDEQLRSCEDLDMWVRIAALTHYSLLLVPEVLTGYRIREGSLSLNFDSFLDAAEKLKERFARIVPGFSASDGQCCFAQALRVSSRKALAARQVRLSRRLLVQAVRAYPLILVRDLRAVVLIAIHLFTFWMPEQAAYASYHSAADLAGSIMSRVIRRKALDSHASHDAGLA